MRPFSAILVLYAEMQRRPGSRGPHEEKGTRLLLADMVLSPLALESITFLGVLLATIGSLFLAYDLLGRENGPLRWFTLVLTCGFVSALVFVPVAIIEALLLGGFKGGFNLFIIVPLILFGGLLGFYTVILVDFSPSERRPPFFSWKGGLLGLVLALLFWFVGMLLGPEFRLPALSLGLACAILTSTWQRLTWDPAQAGVTFPGMGQVVAGKETSASTPMPAGTEQVVSGKLAQPRPHVFSRKGVVLGLLLGFLLCFAFFFSANHDVIASLLESVPFALVAGAICGTWRFLNWEPPHPTPHLFSRKGFWTGLVAGFVPWLLWGFALIYADVPKYTGPLKGLEYMQFLFLILFVEGFAALANAVAGSIAQYTLWRANHLPHRTLGAFGLVLIVVAFALQAVPLGIEILNQIK